MQGKIEERWDVVSVEIAVQDSKKTEENERKRRMENTVGVGSAKRRAKLVIPSKLASVSSPECTSHSCTAYQIRFLLERLRRRHCGEEA